MATKQTPRQTLAVIILAAGKGTRMKNPEMTKVMYPLAGKPMVDYVIDLTTKILADRTLLIIGWKKEAVKEHITALYPKVEFVEQDEQLGTGHAVRQTETTLKDYSGDVLVLSGDVPLLSLKTMNALIGYHRTTEAYATILTADMTDPSGYGRIVRNADSSVMKIVEHKDASPKELKIQEINSGIYLFNKEKLFDSLRLLRPNNVQGEYYLTDVFENFWKNAWRVSAVKVVDPIEVMGINTLEQLETAQTVFLASKNA
ncbi:MAG: sugar phosphate nucleotidyltransferase [Bacteroidota bacterium]